MHTELILNVTCIYFFKDTNKYPFVLHCCVCILCPLHTDIMPVHLAKFDLSLNTVIDKIFCPVSSCISVWKLTCGNCRLWPHLYSSMKPSTLSCCICSSWVACQMDFCGMCMNDTFSHDTHVPPSGMGLLMPILDVVRWGLAFKLLPEGLLNQSFANCRTLCFLHGSHHFLLLCPHMTEEINVCKHITICTCMSACIAVQITQNPNDHLWTHCI